ncbi:recombinase family protein [Nonomuraea angiospora]|uniref:recombinase family protein n=1 Tax=Nonomuraea angiospora TaxID=46172 RepID=UPI0033CDAE4A
MEDLDLGGYLSGREGRGQAILVWKYSRFGRNRMGNRFNLARLEAAGGELVSATEEVDATTVVGKFTRGMLMELAAFESDRSAVGGGVPEPSGARTATPLGGQYFGYVRRGGASPTWTRNGRCGPLLWRGTLRARCAVRRGPGVRRLLRNVCGRSELRRAGRVA